MKSISKRCAIMVLCLSLFCATPIQAREVVYTKADSIKVESLLRKGASQRLNTNIVLFYANQLKGIPYVAQTLEGNSTEKLVVNLRQLDCTTFVETVLSLALTTKEKQPSFAVYCDYLERLRYNGGVMRGYASRNHYFSEWIWSNERLNLVTEINGSGGVGSPFTATQHLNIYYMSKYPERYPMLKNDSEAQLLIRKNEEAVNGTQVKYIPFALLGKGKKELGCVEDGDVLAIVTKKAGLDTSHLGFAVWQNNELHLLNASQLHHKVVLEPMTLKNYMKKHPSQLGVRVIRLNKSKR